MEKHRDFEFTIQESEASMSSTDKRKNERRYRFVFRVVLPFYQFRQKIFFVTSNAESNKCLRKIKLVKPKKSEDKDELKLEVFDENIRDPKTPISFLFQIK